MAVVVDCDRVGVRKPRGRLDLALEPRQGDRVGLRLRLDQLQRTGTLEQLVLSQINLAHPSFAQLPHKVIVAVFSGLMQLAAQSVENV